MKFVKNSAKLFAKPIYKIIIIWYNSLEEYPKPGFRSKAAVRHFTHRLLGKGS